MPRPSRALALCLALAGCAANTEYVPRPGDQLRLVLVKGEFGYGTPAVTNGAGVFDPSQGLEYPFDCDAQARREARRAESAFAAERTWRNVATGGAVAMPPLVPIALPAAAGWRGSGIARLVDAINLHNGAAACRDDS